MSGTELGSEHDLDLSERQSERDIVMAGRQVQDLSQNSGHEDQLEFTRPEGLEGTAPEYQAWRTFYSIVAVVTAIRDPITRIIRVITCNNQLSRRRSEWLIAKSFVPPKSACRMAVAVSLKPQEL
jgi:hypothetical protein